MADVKQNPKSADRPDKRNNNLLEEKQYVDQKRN